MNGDGMNVVGVVLAGGLARRMGGADKGLLELDGRPILDYVLARLAPQVGDVILNANGDPARFDDYGLDVVADPIDGFAGPLAGVLAGLNWTKAHRPVARWIVTVATDTPFFPRDLVARMVAAAAAAGGADLVCAASAGRNHPVFGLWPVALRDDLHQALVVEEIRKVDLWTARHRMAVAEFDAGSYDPFFNANRPEDMAAAETIAREYLP